MTTVAQPLPSVHTGRASIRRQWSVDLGLEFRPRGSMVFRILIPFTARHASTWSGIFLPDRAG